MSQLLTLLSIIFALIALATAKDFTEIDWFTSLDAAKAAAKDNGKPLAVLLTAGYCGACKNLKSSFSRDTSNTFDEIATSFNVVHLADSAQPADKAWSPDGGYIPRLIFADNKGTPLPDIKNSRPQHQYFFHDVFAVVGQMKVAKEIIGQ